MLVECDQRAEHLGGQLLGQDRRGGPVALERPVGHELLGHAVGRDLVGRAAEGEGLGLGEHVGDSRSWWSPSRVERAGEGDEVARHERRPLVDQLVEGVLAVGARLAPVDRAGGVVDAARRRASPTCRCSPSSAAGGRRGSASGTGRRAGRRGTAVPKKSAYQIPRSAISTGGFAANGAVRKCSSIAWKPARSRRKPSGPTRSSARGRWPSPSSSGRRPSPRSRTCCRCRSRTPPRLGVGRDGGEVARDRGLVAQAASGQSRAVRRVSSWSRAS